MTAPIRKSITVPLPTKEAFDLFTTQINSWWPGDSHSISARKGQKPDKIEFGRAVGETITETTPDGARFEWGRITGYDRGRRLSYSWYVGREEADATLVDVTFTPVEAGTRVDLTHSGFERYGETAHATQTDYVTGWDLVLGRYIARCTAGALV